MEEHCAMLLSDGLYDMRGKIASYGFHRANERGISFMKKNYIPKFDVKMLEQYTENNIAYCTKYSVMIYG